MKEKRVKTKTTKPRFHWEQPSADRYDVYVLNQRGLFRRGSTKKSKMVKIADVKFLDFEISKCSILKFYGINKVWGIRIEDRLGNPQLKILQIMKKDSPKTPLAYPIQDLNLDLEKINSSKTFAYSYSVVGLVKRSEELLLFCVEMVEKADLSHDDDDISVVAIWINAASLKYQGRLNSPRLFLGFFEISEASESDRVHPWNVRGFNYQRRTFLIFFDRTWSSSGKNSVICKIYHERTKKIVNKLELVGITQVWNISVAFEDEGRIFFKLDALKDNQRGEVYVMLDFERIKFEVLIPPKKFDDEEEEYEYARIIFKHYWMSSKFYVYCGKRELQQKNDWKFGYVDTKSDYIEKYFSSIDELTQAKSKKFHKNDEFRQKFEDTQRKSLVHLAHSQNPGEICYYENTHSTIQRITVNQSKEKVVKKVWEKVYFNSKSYQYFEFSGLLSTPNGDHLCLITRDMYDETWYLQQITPKWPEVIESEIEVKSQDLSSKYKNFYLAQNGTIYAKSTTKCKVLKIETTKVPPEIEEMSFIDSIQSLIGYRDSDYFTRDEECFEFLGGNSEEMYILVRKEKKDDLLALDYELESAKLLHSLNIRKKRILGVDPHGKYLFTLALGKVGSDLRIEVMNLKDGKLKFSRLLLGLKRNFYSSFHFNTQLKVLYRTKDNLFIGVKLGEIERFYRLHESTNKMILLMENPLFMSLDFSERIWIGTEKSQETLYLTKDGGYFDTKNKELRCWEVSEG